MNKLDTEIINKRSPYLVKEKNGEGVYEFATKHGVHYFVDFMEDDFLVSSNVYQFSIINANHVSSPRDLNVRDTIIAIVDEFFNKNKSALLYICETSDGRQSLRNRLFVSWFEKDLHKNDFVIMTADVQDAEGIMNYAAVIIPLETPNFEEIITEFKNTIMLFKDKPEAME